MRSTDVPSTLRRRRGMLLLLLVPLIGLSALYVTWRPPLGVETVFSPGGRYLATRYLTRGGWDAASFVEIREVGSGRRLGRQIPATCFAFSADGRRLVTGNQDGSVDLWGLDAAERSLDWDHEFQLVDSAINSVYFVGDGQLLIATEGSTTQLVDSTDGQVISTISRNAVVFPIVNRNRIALAKPFVSPPYWIRILEVEGRSVREVEYLPQAHGPAAWTPSGQLAYVTGSLFDGYHVAVRSVDRGEVVSKAPTDGPANIVDVDAADNAIVVLEGKSHPVLVIHRENGPFAVQETHQARTTGISPDGQLVAAAGDAGVTVVWDVQSLRRLHLFASYYGAAVMMSALLLAAVVWCVAWIRNRLHAGPTPKMAIADLLIMLGLPAVACFLRAERFSGEPAGYALLAAVMAAGIALISAIVQLGNSRWSARLCVTLLSVALAWGVGYGVLLEPGLSLHLSGSLLTIVLWSLLLLTLRACGLRMDFRRTTSSKTIVGHQLSLGELMILIASIATCVAAARGTGLRSFSPNQISTILGLSALTGCTALLVILALLSRTPPGIVLIGLFTAAWVSWLNGEGLAESRAVTLYLSTLAVALTLGGLVLRLYGCRVHAL